MTLLGDASAAVTANWSPLKQGREEIENISMGPKRIGPSRFLAVIENEN